MDNAWLGFIDIAVKKAKTAIWFQKKYPLFTLMLSKVKLIFKQ